jgi:hypothetical protein
MYIKRFLAVLLALALAALMLPATTLAAVPGNDDFDNATLIDSLPFTDSLSTLEATTASDDPECAGNGHTVWYRFTPASNQTVTANTFGSNYDTTLSVYTGTRGALSRIACNDDASGLQSRVQFSALAGQTYYLMVGSFYGYSSGNLVFSVEALVPTANDDFANAIQFGGLPFSDSRDTATATTAPDDPNYCGAQGTTVWYAFTPTSDTRIEATTDGSSYYAPVAVFMGSRGALTGVACGYPRVRFDAVAGETYYFMVMGYSRGNLRFSVDVAPPPLSIDLSIDPAGSVVPTTGEATVRGTVTCNRPTLVSVGGTVQQKIGQGLVNGWLWTYVYCDGTTPAPWSSTVYNQPGAPIGGGRAATLFTGGPAEVSMYGYAYDYMAGEIAQDTATGTQVLRGGQR